MDAYSVIPHRLCSVFTRTGGLKPVLKEIKRIWRSLNLRNFVKYSCSSKKSVTVMGFLSQWLPISLAIGKGYFTVAVSHVQPGKDSYIGRVVTTIPVFLRLRGFLLMGLSVLGKLIWLVSLYTGDEVESYHCKSDSCQTVVLRIAVSDHPRTC